MFFSVIIPTYHRNDLLAKCIERLAPGIQTLSAERYEVIVTDDGVKTTAGQMIRDRYPWIKWIKGPQKGLAANRNNAAWYAKGEWLVFVDDDCLPDTRWLKSYKDAIQTHAGAKIFGGSISPDKPKQSLAEYAPILDQGNFLGTANMCVHKDLFEEMGGMDERYCDSFEDVDFACRLKKAGHVFIWLPEANVRHPWRITKSLRDEWKNYNRFFKALLLYLEIHPEEKLVYTSIYYIKDSIRHFVRVTAPGLIKYRGKGSCKELLYYLAILKISRILLPNCFKKD